MRRLILTLSALLLLLSCSVTDFEVTASSVEKSVTFNKQGSETVFSLAFGFSSEDDYSLEVRDEYGLLWSSKFAHLKDEDYKVENLAIPYITKGQSTLDYRVINSAGKVREGYLILPATGTPLWAREGNELIPVSGGTDSTISWKEGPIGVKKPPENGSRFPMAHLMSKSLISTKASITRSVFSLFSPPFFSIPLQ
jgi:hypothetical protein